MASLSDLLNPAPAAKSPPETSQLPPNPYAPTDARGQQQPASERDVVNPSTVHSDPLARRMSAFGEGPFNTLPPAGDMIRRLSTNSHDMHTESQAQRKMSSPSLEQYHMSSRSPEQIRRRSSILEVAHPTFTLPPLQYTEPQHQHSSTPPSHILQAQPEKSEEVKGASDDFSHAVPPPLSTEAQSDGDLKTTIPETTSSPSAASHQFPSGKTPSSAHPDAIPPLIKSETTMSAQDIPAFIPVAPIVKREQSAIPSTEDVPATTTESRGTKRPAPKSAKKGIAKKGPPAKKQKTEPTKSKTKSKVKLDKSATATPLDASPAPRSRTSASPAAAGISDDEEDEDVDMGSPDPDAEVYCICRRPDTGTFMIGCDGKCDDWYHGKCVDILEKDKNLIDRYICPVCTKNGVGVTTWKRMCRREGCRMPARLAKKDEEPSKYCSDECGVIFFRRQMDKTRGGAESKRSSRKQQESLPNDDLGPRGGVIHASELKSLVTSASTFEDFKKLGDGVLSPPATPSPTQSKRNANSIKAEEYLDEIQAQRLKDIQIKKDELRKRHTLLKDQTKMINLVRQAGLRAAESKGMKPKDVCGYDDLVHLTESDLAAWRESPEGQAALKTGVLEAGVDTEGSSIRASGPCLKKKCLKHYEWSKLALETNRSETMENSETMRALEREERDIRERAGLKARQVKSGDLGGHVEIHAGQTATKADDGNAEIGIEGPA